MFGFTTNIAELVGLGFLLGCL